MRRMRTSLARVRNPRKATLIALALVACLALTVPVLAQISAAYDLSWHAIAGGGGRMSSAQHTLAGTTGQASIGQMSSGGHMLCSGFWCGAAAEAETGGRVYIPFAVRDTP